MLSPKRDTIAAKHFFRLALARAGQIRPRLINVDGRPAYPQVIADLNRTGELGRNLPLPPGALSEQHPSNRISGSLRNESRRVSGSGLSMAH